MYDTLHLIGIEYESDTNQMYDSFHARFMDLDYIVTRFDDRRDMVMDEIHAMLRTSEKSTC